jgi:aldose sugar dehydrogenase
MMNKKIGLAIAALLYFLALLFLPGIRDSQPPWDFSLAQWMVSGVFSAALAAALLIMFLAKANDFISNAKFSYVLIVTSFSVILFALYFSDISISRVVILYSLVFLVAVIVMFLLTRNAALHLLVSLATLSLILFNYNYDWRNIGGKPSLDDNSKYALSGYHDLKVTDYKVKMSPGWKRSGGALAHIGGDRGLLISADGLAFELAFNDSSVHSNKIEFSSPLELARYRENAPNPGQWYRITDALVHPELNRLFLTYTFWSPDRQCYTIRLSSIEFDLSTYRPKGDWELLFESSPCIKSLGNESGGRMSLLDNNTLLFTVGVFNFYSIDASNVDASEVEAANYGKTYTLDLGSSELSVFTTGHRNSQGLLVDGDEIWSTEHGPYGGDELNLLVKGNDYGWPYYSYGTDYRQKILSSSNTIGDHSKGTRPIYAWLPSIGISNIIRYTGDEFPAWNGDLIIGSLRGMGSGYSLYRVRIREGRAVTSERIKTGLPVRDLAELPDGRILLWSGKDVIQLLERGENVFSQCAGCHPTRALFNGIGPSLSGVVNSKVASVKGYDYSQAMSEFGGKWTESRLDNFLKNPAAAVPGTAMDFPGVEDEETRQEIIRYLGQF